MKGCYKFKIEDAILDFIGKIVKNIESENRIIAIFLDLTKAFDTVDYRILYNELEYTWIW